MVVEETATTGAALLFGVFAVLILLAFRNLAGIIIAGYFTQSIETETTALDCPWYQGISTGTFNKYI